MEINLQKLQKSHFHPFPHSPPDNGLLEIFANGKRFSHKHVAHDDLKAVGHEWHHCVRLQSPAPGDDAKPLERGAVTQCLEELGAGTEVWLFQPAGINKNKSMGNSCLGRSQTRGKDTAHSWGVGKWIKQCLQPWRTRAQIGRKALNCRIPAPTGSNPGVTLVLQVSHEVWWIRQALDLSSRSILVLQAQPGFCYLTYTKQVMWIWAPSAPVYKHCPNWSYLQFTAWGEAGMKNTQCTKSDAELGPTQWPQPALAKDQSYSSPTGRTTSISSTFTLNTWPREERQDPLSQWSRRTTKWHSEAIPGQQGICVLTSSISGWLPHRNQPAGS